MADEMQANSPLCAVCQTTIAADEATTSCPACAAPYHTECWEENRGCGVYGCTEVPPTEHRANLEIPVSYWGQEHKACPVCQTQILAAAVRCRVCGTNFGSARPQDAEEFKQRALLNVRAPSLKKKVGWMFALCVLPCTSPLATIVGAIWYSMRRAEIRALPALYSALCKIGLAVGFGQMVIAAVVLLALAARPH
jgi:hypothetical protein